MHFTTINRLITLTRMRKFYLSVIASFKLPLLCKQFLVKGLLHHLCLNDEFLPHTTYPLFHFFFSVKISFRT